MGEGYSKKQAMSLSVRVAEKGAQSEAGSGDRPHRTVDRANEGSNMCPKAHHLGDQGRETAHMANSRFSNSKNLFIS